MSRNYYVLSNGRVQREDNTLSIINAEGKKRPIPVEDVESLYIYGEVDINTRLLNFLSQKRIALHVFNYYGFYSGSYYPREYLNSGHLLVKQVSSYGNAADRLAIAREIVAGAAHSILRNVAYYSNRKRSAAAEDDAEPYGEIGAADEAPTPSAEHLTPLPPAGVPTDEDAEFAIDSARTEEVGLNDGAEALTHDAALGDPLLCDIDLTTDALPLDQLRAVIHGMTPLIERQGEVNELRGVEGKIRERYYKSWRYILSEEFYFTTRVRRPPDNEINALISFGNSMLYTVCLAEIYRTQLTPTISYLHEPGTRRFSLALDISELFKPLVVDRAIFKLVNTGQLKPEHFDRSMDACYLNDVGKKLYLATLEERLASTIRHRRLGRHVSYRHLIRLECYKLIRHLTGVEPYRAFRAWW